MSAARSISDGLRKVTWQKRSRWWECCQDSPASLRTLGVSVGAGRPRDCVAEVAARHRRQGEQRRGRAHRENVPAGTGALVRDSTALSRYPAVRGGPRRLWRAARRRCVVQPMRLGSPTAEACGSSRASSSLVAGHAGLERAPYRRSPQCGRLAAL